MRLVIRLVACLVVSVLLISVSTSYYQVQTEKRRLRKELSRRAEVVAEGLDTTAETLLTTGTTKQLQRIVNRFCNKEHLIGVAVYDADGAVVSECDSLAKQLSDTPSLVTRVMNDDAGAGEFLRLRSARVHYYATPLRADGDVIGALLIVHDVNYIAVATRSAWKDMSLRVILQVLVIALATVLIFQRSVLKPIARTAAWMRELRHGRTPLDGALPDADMFGPLAREATSLADSLAAARASAEIEASLRDAAASSWTAERLAAYLRTKLNSSRLFVVANREPYVHTRQGKTVQVTVPASGLVTALEPILRACDGTWIAHGSGDADRETVDDRDCLRVPPDDPRYKLRRVWLTSEEEEGYYYGFSNEGLWPLCHIAHTRPMFRSGDWEHYKRVNEKFADTVIEEMAGTEHPVVIVQDYHFALLPKLIKQRRPDARVGIFWHIPWPNPEAFGICPWQHELLEGLLGADLIGFHVQYHCDNFLETVNRALESRVVWEHFAVDRGDHLTLVRPFPISVVFPDDAETKPGFHVRQTQLLEELGLDAFYLGVGVDRIDYTKGIIERLLGVERFLEKYPQYQGRFSFVQIGAPSRTRIKRYKDFLFDVEEETARINARFARGRWKPIIFRKRHHSHAEVERFYRAADVCLVTSLHDGMNLVAKEFLASRQDEGGMLVLSEFTGAARELHDALIVNPYDTDSVADAILAALEMNEEEQKARMRRMRQVVRDNNVYRWAGSLIGELCELRLPPRRRDPKELTQIPPARITVEVTGKQALYDFDDTGTMRAESHKVGA